VAAGVLYASRRGVLGSPEERRAAIGVLVYAFVFAFLINLGTKKADRYLLPIFPALDLLAGLGLSAVGAWVGKRGGLAVCIVGIAGQLAFALPTYPYYLSYYNPVMGGPRKAPEVMLIGWGEGLDQAAAYLNSKPHAKRLKVIAWYSEGSFEYFFKGKSVQFPITQEPSPERLQKILKMDYAVIYIQQWQRHMPQTLLDILDQRKPEFSVWINGLEYVRVYKLDG